MACQDVEVHNVTTAARFWSIEDMLAKIGNLVYETMGDNITEHMDNHDNWLGVFREHPEKVKILVIDEKIKGLMVFLMLNDLYFGKAKNGELAESTITVDTILALDKPGEYKMYLVDIAIAQEHRTLSNFTKLITSFMCQLEKYASGGMFVMDWCANAHTPDGEKVCKMLGMRHICDYKGNSGGKIYYNRIDFETLQNKFFQRYPEFVKLYTEHLDNIN